jgi:serine/threonine-protein kinase RsbW
MVMVPLRLCVWCHDPAGSPEPDEHTMMCVTVPSDLDLVEHAVDLVARHCLAHGLPTRAVRFNLRVALSEALANAIVYGNRLDPGKGVRVALRCFGDKLEVHVQDQGPGFDPTGLPDPTAPDHLQRSEGRGLFLIRELVDDLAFNEEGNGICMTMHCA